MPSGAGGTAQPFSCRPPPPGGGVAFEVPDGGVGAVLCHVQRCPLSHRWRDDSSPYRASTSALHDF